MWTDCTMIKKIKETDWWEVSYLTIYGIIFSKEFLQTTMFPIAWPLGLGYVFALMSGGYVIAKFLFHNTYSKKETILAALVLIAFCVPAFTTDYTYLFWTGCLIVGAKDVDFNKILKVYLILSVTFIVTAFSASQGGLIEDLLFNAYRYGIDFPRHSYGIIYPTDYAAHLFYIVLATEVLFDEKMNTKIKVWLSVLVGGSVFFTGNAQTSLLCLIGFSFLCVLERMLGKNVHYIEKILRWTPIVCAVIFLGLVFIYNPQNETMVLLDDYLSGRLIIANEAFQTYDIELFGQNIKEVGHGLGTDWSQQYFFLDDAYVSILLKYGVVLLVVSLFSMLIVSKRAVDEKKYILVIALVAISIHSIMEHRLIDMAYNPMILALFAFLTNGKQIDGRKTCIEETVKVG